MPSPKQMEKLAREAALRRDHATPDPGPGDPMPEQLWDAVLANALYREAGAAEMSESA
jgi:hypothetical protein